MSKSKKAKKTKKDKKTKQAEPHVTSLSPRIMLEPFPLNFGTTAVRSGGGVSDNSPVLEALNIRLVSIYDARRLIRDRFKNYYPALHELRPDITDEVISNRISVDQLLLAVTDVSESLRMMRVIRDMIIDYKEQRGL